MNDISELYYQLLSSSIPAEVMLEDERRKTAKRAADSWHFLLSGYHQNLSEVVGDALYPTSCNELVVVEQVAFNSLCEHHLLPIVGVCHIAYLPHHYLLGLSKFARIVDMFARRLQLQERMTREIAEAVQQVTDAKGVGVIVTARHYCMSARGVERREAAMTTHSRLGGLESPEIWQQFIHSVTTK